VSHKHILFFLEFTVYVEDIGPSDLTDVHCFWSNAYLFTLDQTDVQWNSSPEPQDQLQPNLVQIILDYREFNNVSPKGDNGEISKIIT
jgi:hypothetical protein